MRKISPVMIWAGGSGGAEGGCRCRLAGKASLLITWPFCPYPMPRTHTQTLRGCKCQAAVLATPVKSVMLNEAQPFRIG